LKSAMNMNEKNLQKNLERVIVSIGFVERRIKLMSDEIFNQNQ